MRIKSLDRACPLCRGKTGDILLTQSYILPEDSPLSAGENNPISRDVVSCEGCGFTFADSPIKQSAYLEYYTKFAKHAQASAPQPNRHISSFNATLIDQIQCICENRAQTRIADAGCGSGGLLVDLKSRGFGNLCGIDVSPLTGRFLQDLGITYLQGNITDEDEIAGIEEPFEIVSLVSVMEHLSDLDKAIAKVSSMLRDGGHLLISVPDASQYHTCLPNPIFQINLEHINHFDSESLSNLLALHGFEQKSSENHILKCARFTSNQMIHIFRKTGIQNQIRIYSERACRSIRTLATAWQECPSNRAIETLVKTQEEVTVYGVGIYAYNMLAETPLKDCNIVSFVDGNPHKQGQNLMGKPVRSPVFLKDFNGHIVVCVANEPNSVLSALGRLPVNNPVHVV